MRSLLFSFGCFLVVCVEASAMLEVSGHVGGEVSIPCFGNWTADGGSGPGRACFCRGVCSRKSTLIRTEMRGPAVTRRGRYSVGDDRGDGVTVTIRRLRMADAGTYYCEVERTLNASNQEVNLKVLDASTVSPGYHPSINMTLQREEAAPSQGSFSLGPELLPTPSILPPFKKNKTQKNVTRLTDTTVVILVSGSMAFLVCAFIPLIFYRHWRSHEGQNSTTGNKPEGEENAENESAQTAVGLQSLEPEVNPETSTDDNIQYAAVYEALDPKNLD
ncbi:uncharacterized protein ACNS7B_012291 isoform 1-T1 [Menidia menidia]